MLFTGVIASIASNTETSSNGDLGYTIHRIGDFAALTMMFELGVYIPETFVVVIEP